MVAGTPLKEEELARIPLEEYYLDAQYNVTTGEAYSRFLSGLREGRILGTRCSRCGSVFVPPKVYCPYCFRRVDDWVEASDEGVVVTAVVSYVSGTRERLEKPIVVGVVRLNVPGHEFGERRFPGIMHYLCVDPDVVRSMRIFGMRVKAAWRKDRVGSILDIECFRPIG
jgi:hypothetical protein